MSFKQIKSAKNGECVIVLVEICAPVWMALYRFTSCCSVQNDAFYSAFIKKKFSNVDIE